MLHMIAGGEDKWRARPFVSQSNCFVVPPLKFAQDACRCLELAVRRRHAGAAAVGGAGRRDGAGGAGRHHRAGGGGVLVGLIYVNALKPGAPAIFGTWPFVSDLRTGAMSGGSPEQALLSAGCAQMFALLRPHRRHRLGHDAIPRSRTRRPATRRPTTTRWSAMPAPT